MSLVDSLTFVKAVTKDTTTEEVISLLKLKYLWNSQAILKQIGKVVSIMPLFIFVHQEILSRAYDSVAKSLFFFMYHGAARVGALSQPINRSKRQTTTNARSALSKHVTSTTTLRE